MSTARCPFNQAELSGNSPRYNGFAGTQIWRLQKTQNRPNPDQPKSMWQKATDAAVARQQAAELASSSAYTGKVPVGFKPIEEVPETICLPSKRPATGTSWYYSEQRQLFWSGVDSKLYSVHPVSREPIVFYEGVASEMRVSVGACFHADAVQSRFVLAKDLSKVAKALGTTFDHLDQPCALYALYEGHRGEPRNSCTDFCVKNLHQKLLLKLGAFRGYWEDWRLKETMIEVFQDLDAEYAISHPSTEDGCCATMALLMGERLVIASLGDIACVVFKRNGETYLPFKGHTIMDPDDEEDEEDDDPAAGAIADPAMAMSAIRWTRAFGDLDFKQPMSRPRLSVTPDVDVLYLDSSHGGVAIVCRALYNAIGREPAISTVFKRARGRPRMASGTMLDAAVQWLGHVNKVESGLGSIVACFDNLEETAESAQKRQKVSKVPSQVRVRHILIKHRELKSNTKDTVRNKQVTRTRGEAERILRAVLEECEVDPKKSASAFTKKCREVSECASAKNDGELAGDVGWVKPGRNEQKFGPAFDPAAFSLQVGQLSDLIDSDQGIHILIRAA